MTSRELNNTIYIARDEGEYIEDTDIPTPGKLHLFYDTPELNYNSDTRLSEFTNARCICELPSYMYPNIENCEVLVIRF